MQTYESLIMGTVPDFYVVLGSRLDVLFANRSFCDSLAGGSAEIEANAVLWDVDNGSWDILELRALFDLDHSPGLVRHCTFDRESPKHGPQTISATAHWVCAEGDGADVIVLRAHEMKGPVQESSDDDAHHASVLEEHVRARTNALNEQREAALQLAQAAEQARLEALKASAALQRSDVQLRQSQKMEAVGKLAGGIAHDFNNLLTAILCFSGFAIQRLTKSDANYSDLLEVRKAARRAANLTEQLLAFSQKRPINPQTVDPNEKLRDLERMLTRLLDADIELLTHLHADVGAIKIDTTALEQIIVNLAVNARDAMPHGGQLIVETARVTLDGEQSAAKGQQIPAGEYVTISVSDTGMGMDAETQQHIFEPFFTTKDVGKGTGLGLSTVYGIVRQAGGYLWVYSELGKGTTFRLCFPRAEPLASASEGDLQRAIQGGGETILVAEDDDQIRALCQRVLSPLGYRVLVAASGVEALEICEREGAGIDLLLSDVVMPKMGGKTLAMRLGQLHPEVKVLFMSGYTPSAIVHHGVVEHGVMLLQKPFIPDELALKVRAVLGADAHYARSFAPHRRKILLVEDDDDVRILAEGFLREDYEVVAVHTGERALELIKLSPPDLVICACLAAGLDGLQLYSSVIALNPHLVEHFLFAVDAMDEECAKRLRGTGRPLIKKPFRGDDLLDAVRLAFTTNSADSASDPGT